MSVPLIVVREMTRTDLDQVLEIEGASFGVPWTRGMFEAELGYTPGWTRVALDERGVVLGFLVCRFYGDLWHVMDLAVRPQHRRRGVGGRLLDEFLAAVSGTHADVLLEVRPSNVEARALYESRGFQEVGRRRAYYPDNSEDALIMIWRFGSTP
ncbi:MAG: ribosomal protein S18-alanine N-acetyltransferase [Thermoleophilia bacterium]|nr:ribosomal protein S18-alanine N-acetyltransferase [Thermoleophilia bacterium]